MPERLSFAAARRVPLIPQQERAECGLACIAMIAGYFGRRVSLHALRAQRPPSARGATLDELVRAAADLRLMARPVRLELAEIGQLKLPAILHWRLDHFVVLVHLRGRKAIVNDPAEGRLAVSRRELDTSFTGVAVEISAAPDFEKRDERGTLSPLALLGSCRRLTRYLGFMLLLLCVIQLLSLLPPVATQLLIDEVVLAKDLSWLVRALAGLGAVLGAAAILDAMRRWIALYSGTVLATDTTQQVVQHLYALPVQFLHNRHLGDLVSRLDSLEPVREAITETAINGFVQTIVVLATLAIMFYYSPALTVVSLAGMLAAAALLAAVLPASRRSREAALVHQARHDSSLLETLRAAGIVQALGLAPLRLAQWHNHFVASTNARVRAGKLMIWQGLGSSLIGAAEQLLFLGVGIRALLEQRLTLGVLFAFMTLRGRLAQATVALFAAVQELFMLRMHVGRLADIVLAEASPAPPPGAIVRPVRGSLDVRNVSFRYPGGPWILVDFSCVIHAGESVAITGPSGCGKSTLLRLMSAQLPVTRGQLLIDGRELALWHTRSLQRQFAIVLQEDALFRGSLAENIAGFAADPDLGRIREAAVAAEIWQDIERMPMMLETPVGDMGSTLSGGQRQRVALARAFYRAPKVLFLDEATSHLDLDTERRVLEHVETLGITVVCVAHRPDAIRRADRILHLSEPRPAP